MDLTTTAGAELALTNSSVSDNESDMLKLLRRGRVGDARVRRHKDKYWEIDFSFPGGLQGGRRRYYRSSATETYRLAMKLTREMKEHGKLGYSLSSSERWVATECFRLLKELTSEPETLLYVVKDYLRRHPDAGMARTFEQVVDELISKKKKSDLRPRYVSGLEYRLGRIVEEIGSKRISKITAEDIEEFLATHPHWGPRTIAGFVQSMKIVFYYAIKRGYTTENPCNRLELPKPPDVEPQILDVETIKKLFSVAKSPELDCSVYLALALFTGLRQSELAELMWEQVDLENKTVVVLTASAKGRARRIVDISPNLEAWLRPAHESTGPIFYPIVKYRTHLTKAMGWERWPQNVLRHCFASYHYAKHRNEALLMQLMGHGDDGRILHNHYRALVQPNDAKAYWEIYPI